MLKIKRGMRVPPDALPEEAFDDYPSALNWIYETSNRQDFVLLDKVQSVAAEFPLLAGTEVEYWEASKRDLAQSGLSARDQAELTVCLINNPAGVLLYDEPKLIVSLDALNPSTEADVIRHELVHLEQLVRGDTVLVPDGQLWQRVLYRKSDLMDINAAMSKNIPGARYCYLNLPWEREAYVRGYGQRFYESKLRWAFLVMKFSRRQPQLTIEQASNLALSLCTLRAYFEDSLDLSNSRITVSGMMIAQEMTDGNLVETEAMGSAFWAYAGVLLKERLSQRELTTPDETWQALAQLAAAFFETYMVEQA